MPKEYEHCKESYLKKGYPEKKAKAICAGMYYNRHKMTVKEAKERGIKNFMKMLYVARTKSALETLLDSLELDGFSKDEFVIVPISDEIRNNAELKSVNSKIANKEYKYLMVHKSAVDVTRDAKLVILTQKLKENEVSKQNDGNEPHKEKAHEVVSEGKLKSMLAEEEVLDDVVTKADETELPTLSDVMRKVREGKKLSKVERHILSVALDASRGSSKTSKEERDEVNKELSEGKDLSEKSKEVLEREFGEEGEKMEEKALTASSSVVEAVEHEDLEGPKKQDEESEDKDKEEEKTKSILSRMLKSFGSLDDQVPVFSDKMSADKFARHYNLYHGHATVRRATIKETSVYGPKARYVVELF